MIRFAFQEFHCGRAVKDRLGMGGDERKRSLRESIQIQKRCIAQGTLLNSL